MKKIVYFSPGISSMNLGDKIIAESAKENIQEVIKQSFNVEISTHLPTSYYYMRHLRKTDYKFVLGSNLLKSTFFGFKRQWDITIRKSLFNGPSILIGAGWWQYNNKPNLYTKILYKIALDKNHLHSVRDEYTKEMLNSIGINNVINTACPTMWKLTPEHCANIKTAKSNNVVFTITDYNIDIENDSLMIDTLKKNYKNIYFWPQGLEDFKYFNDRLQTSGDSNVKVLEPTLEAFNNILEAGEIDYVGTRLHGGVRALQKKVRTIIVAIDNRAIEKNKTFNLPVILRDNMSDLDEMINSEFKTNIKLPLDNINKWKNQFLYDSK